MQDIEGFWTDMIGPGRSPTQRCCQSCRDLAGGERPRWSQGIFWRLEREISVQLA